MAREASTVRGAISMLALAVASCTPDRAATQLAANHAASAIPPAPPTKHACAYELAAKQTPLVMAPVSAPAGGVAGGKVLLAYQLRADPTSSIRARLFDPAHPPGAELLLSPTDGMHADAAVIPHGSRFLVKWRRERPDEKDQGRWVDADGSLGPIVELPFAGSSGMRLAPRDQGFVGAYTDRDVLYTVSLDANLKPTASPVRVDVPVLGIFMFRHVVLANGQIWVAIAGKSRNRETRQVHVVRLEASGTLIGHVEEVSNAELQTALPQLIEVSGGVLFAWWEGTHHTSGTLWTRKIGLSGKPLGPPVEVGASGTWWEGLQLLLDAGEPLLNTQRGHNLRLDTNGTRKAAARAFEATTSYSIWLPISPQPLLAFTDHGDGSALMLAPLRCSRDTVGPR